MQRLDRSFVLKGGAAAQLFLQPSLQRGSRDADLVTKLGRDAVAGYLSELQSRFDVSGMEIKPYSPKAPAVGLPLVTYEVYFEPLTYRAIFGSDGRQDYIKLEVLSEDAEMPTTVIGEKETPALKVRGVKSLTLGALTGDKLTTLAAKTIGVIPEELPKQLYDVDNLVFSNDLTRVEVSHIMRTFQTRANAEIEFRKGKESPLKVLEDVINAMSEFSKADLASGDRNIRQHIRNFESSYVNRRSVLSPSGWSSRALRVKFLAGLLKLGLEDKASEADIVKRLDTAKRISDGLGDSGREAREWFLRRMTSQRELRGKPLNRLFWEAVNFIGIEELQKRF